MAKKISVRGIIVAAVLVMGLLGVPAARAAVKLPAVIGDNMVLQQGQPVPVWGWADKGEEITVTADNQKQSTKAGDDGCWKVTLKKMTPGKPKEITVKGSSGNSITLTNVLVGEVWVCSGQSNMEMGIGKIKDAQQEIAAANYPDIRLFLVPKTKAAQPATDVKATWAPCTSQSVAVGGWDGFSAAAFFFGREIHKELKIPIGLIETAWGGTPAEFWTSRKTLESNPTLKPLACGDSSSLYNGQLAPLMPYAIKGVIWYQGESNLRRAFEYRTLFPAMIENWRADWGQGDFPFGFVQLAPYRYGDQNPANFAELCESQLLTLKNVPNTGMAVTLDIGDVKDIHPKNKQDVGRRLALWALAKVYENKKLVYSGPIYKSMKVKGNKIRLEFEHCGGGLKASDGKPLSEFTIASANEEFLPAKAEIDHSSIVVSCDQVAAPVAVRYAWHDTAQPNLVNQEGLPASLFRTDSWTNKQIVTAEAKVTNNVKPQEKLYQERLRPQFHFTARYWDDYMLHPPMHHEGWVNDMNGLMYNQGEFHFFAQRWWSAWLHAVSTDLVHWEELKPAFGKGGQFGGTQSGGGVVDFNNCSGLGDGKEPPMLVFWSSTDNLNQCMSYSRDKGRTWTKYEKNPVLVHEFRDPNVFWYEPGKKWIMILYGPSNAGSQNMINYGFNGEYNDAHNLRECNTGEWMCSVIRMSDDGKVVVTDQNGQASGSIDAKRQNLAAEVFRVGAKANNSEFLDGDIAELLVYDRTISDDETKQTIASLQAKWKLKDSIGEARIPTEGVVLHLDAGQLAANGPVPAWKDISGKGSDMKQADSARMPERVAYGPGGLPVVHFAGKQFLQGLPVLAAGDNSFSLVALWRRKQANDSEVICEQNCSTKQPGRRASFMTACKGNNSANVYLLFSSTNLLEWKKLDTCIQDSYECPSMFELPVEGDQNQKKWVVVKGNGDYVAGSFDGNSFTPETKNRKGDYGPNFYATMTFNCMPKNDPRRIQMAWMRWNNYPADMPFNQQASFPCELTLHKLPEGIIMFRYPIREIASLYGKELSIADRVIKPGENPLSGLEGGSFDIDLKIDATRSTCSEIVFTLCGSTVKYNLKSRNLNSLGAGVQLDPRSGMVEIRILVDRLSVETFGNHGEVSITTSTVHDKFGTPNLVLSAEGGDAAVVSLVAHELKSSWRTPEK